MYLIFRVDASVKTGTGHLMRCISLAQAWQSKGYDCIFITHCTVDNIMQKLEKLNCNIINISNVIPVPSDFDGVIDELPDTEKSWVIMDGYYFNLEYQRNIINNNYRSMIIDDFSHFDTYSANLILNPNSGAEKLNYNCEIESELLLGPSYFLLREEFLSINNKKYVKEKVDNIIVTMGGMDLDNVTLDVIKALKKIHHLKLNVKVVVGSGNPNIKSIEDELDSSGLQYEVIFNAKNMAALMNWADIAISAAGGTCWELLYMKVPAICIVLAENQKNIAEELHEKGAIKNIGYYSSLSIESLANEITSLIESTSLRNDMVENGMEIIDGNGCDRVVNILEGRIYE
jgi:UDP-2,4-diacetamido-2,4,6-trideoxy-beta-L-altropyranose hydrolase